MGYEKSIKAALLAGTLLECKSAKDKGASSRSAEASAVKGRSWDVESSIKVVCEAEGELAGRIATLVKVGKGLNRLDDAAYLKERSTSIGILR